MKDNYANQHFFTYNYFLRLIHGSLDYFANANKKENVTLVVKSSSSNTKNNNDFVKSIIHELKSPLHAISGLSKILQDEKGFKISPKERMEYLHNIDESVNDLNELVHDLLDVSVSGNEQTNFSIDLTNRVDIKEIVRRTIKLNKDYALQSYISIKSEILEDIDFINLDPKRTKQILNNLISNAVKYSPKRTEITVRVRRIVKNNNKYLEIEVSDEGFGMTEEQIETAFEKYKTIKNSKL